MSVKKWIVVSGLSWLVIGAYLMVKGLKWITAAMMLAEVPPLIRGCLAVGGSVQQGALLLICLALLVGFVKGRMVLSNSVGRIVTRLRDAQVPISFSKAYDRKYWMIIGSMMALGMVLRFLPISLDVRGAIDVAIGSALINGAMLYFREAVIPSKSFPR